MTALSDIDVLDLTEDYAGYTGKLLSDLGAEVTKVERPPGDPARKTPPRTTAGPNGSAFFGFLNTGKRGIVLDPASDDDLKILERLISCADIILEDHLPDYGIAPKSIPETYPDTSVISITGFGRTGSFADYESVDLIEVAMSGLCYQTGYPHRPPTRPGLSISSYFGATYAAIGALLAIEATEQAGGQHVDVSNREAIAGSLEATNLDFAYNDEIANRSGSKHPAAHPCDIYPVDDGYVSLSAAGQPIEGPLGGLDSGMWISFCQLLGLDELLEDERFNSIKGEPTQGGTKRRENFEALNARAKSGLQGWKKSEFYHTAQEREIAAAPLQDASDIFEDDQLAVRGFLKQIPLPNGDEVTMPTAPYQFDALTLEQTRAPRLDEHGDEIRAELKADEPDSAPSSTNSSEDESSKPLEDVCVLDFTMVWAGPRCTATLADHGADVIKVESIQRLDGMRRSRPRYDHEQGVPEYGEDRSGMFQQENRGKRSLTVDLQTDTGIDLIRKMVESGEVDVVVEAFTPGVMDRLGLGYSELRKLDEEMIMCSLSGYGQEGPESQYRAYGPPLEAHSGIAQVTGFPEDRPVRTGISFTDPIGGLNAAFAIIAALHHRDRTGRGEYIDLSQLECGVTMVHPAITTYDIDADIVGRTGNRDEHGSTVQGVYPCAETQERSDQEEWIAIAIRDESDWVAFSNVVDEEWTAEDRFATQDARLKHHDEFDAFVGEWTQERDRYRIMTRLQAAGIPAGVVQTTKDLLENDAILNERAFWQSMDHPVIGEQPYPGPTPDLSQSPRQLEGYAPLLGQHTREVLYDILDISGDRIAELEQENILK